MHPDPVRVTMRGTSEPVMLGSKVGVRVGVTTAYHAEASRAAIESLWQHGHTGCATYTCLQWRHIIVALMVPL